jgi:hypothetical protein
MPDVRAENKKSFPMAAPVCAECLKGKLTMLVIETKAMRVKGAFCGPVV